MKYIVKINYGYGYEYEEVEAEGEDEALEMAYEAWRDAVETNADYSVVGEWTEELANDYL